MTYSELIDALDRLYDQASEIAGPNPNALGFMRDVPGSRYFRKPPIGAVSYSPTEQMIKGTIFNCRVVIRIGKWPNT